MKTSVWACVCGGQVVEESQQREMVQQFLDLLDQPFFSKQPLPTIPNLPPKPAAAPDPSQVRAAGSHQ